MAWYETQIIGVVVGGLIVFVANFVSQWNERRIMRINLQTGVKAEIKAVLEAVFRTTKTLRGYIEDIRKEEVPHTLKIISPYETVFIDRNLDKLGILDKGLIHKILNLRGLYIAYGEGMTILSDLIPEVIEGNINTNDFIRQLEKAVNNLNRVRKLGQEIIDLLK